MRLNARLLAGRGEVAAAMGELDLAFKLKDMGSRIHLENSDFRRVEEELRASQRPSELGWN
ncbi:hypothetical protein EIM92_16170 [Paenibacillus lentus]|uniref:Uncharacterized protein n=1 Tax=Paenibacillus lentus TaxID=1338368 RepID=A0A3S8RWG4_9BACL|nr:hypothetical protein EIM92_16170 [Paenibacillus lentus]